MKGVDMLTAVLITRLCMGHSERLSAQELACGSFTLVGITLIARPTFLFGQNPPVDTAEPADADTAALQAEGFRKFEATGRVWAHLLTEADVAAHFPGGSFMASWNALHYNNRSRDGYSRLGSRNHRDARRRETTSKNT